MTIYRAGAIFKFEMCQSAWRHPVYNRFQLTGNTMQTQLQTHYTKKYFVYSIIHVSARKGHRQALGFYININLDEGPFALKHVACCKQNTISQ